MKDIVDAYFSELKFRFDVIRQHSSETDLFLSSRFNVFDYIYVDENRLSDIISDLLNPSGKHGQSDLFLNEFIKLIKRTDYIQKECPKVNREVGTRLISKTQRRMDILIEWHRQGIMIENKPWANDQDDQLFDYKQYLERRFEENFLIVYLSRGNQKPTENSISLHNLDHLIGKSQFIQISFENEIKLWIRNCIKECNSEKMRWFLRDFSTYLDDTFN